MKEKMMKIAAVILMALCLVSPALAGGKTDTNADAKAPVATGPVSIDLWYGCSCH